MEYVYLYTWSPKNRELEDDVGTLNKLFRKNKRSYKYVKN